MRILVVGASGTIGRAVVSLLGASHEIIAASRSHPTHPVDVTQPNSIASLFQRIGRVDAVVSLSGGARFAPFDRLTAEDFQFSLTHKLMGQVQLARTALAHLNDGGVVVLTSGVLAWRPMVGSAAIGVVNGALEGFVAAAALEAPRRIRVNVVSPPWVTETLQELKWTLPGGRPASEVAQLYAASLADGVTGQVFAFGPKGVHGSALAERYSGFVS